MTNPGERGTVMVERSGMARRRPVADGVRADALGHWLEQEATSGLVPLPDGIAEPAASAAADPGRPPGDALKGPAQPLPSGWWILPALALSLPAWALFGWLAFG